jgi:hypothetical protein
MSVMRGRYEVGADQAVEPDAVAEHDRREMDDDLVEETCVEALVRNVGTEDLDIQVTGRLARRSDGVGDTVRADDHCRIVLYLGWPMCEDEDRPGPHAAVDSRYSVKSARGDIEPPSSRDDRASTAHGIVGHGAGVR